MIQDIFKIIYSYFKIVKVEKFWFSLLVFGSLLGHIAQIIIPLFAANIIVDITNQDYNGTYINIVFLFFTYIFNYGCDYLNYFSYSRNMTYVYKSLRIKIIDNILKYDLSFTNKISKAKILNTINADVGRVSEMSDQITEFVIILFMLVIYIIIFININIFIGIIMFFVILIYLYIFNYCNIRIIKNLRKQVYWKDKVTEIMNQTINGLSEIKMFNIESKIKRDYITATNKWCDAYKKRRKYVDLSYGLLPLFPHIAKIGLYLYLAYFVIDGKYEISLLILVIAYFESILSNSMLLMEYSETLRDWSISIERVNTLLNYSDTNTFSFGNYGEDNILGLVKFDKVDFKYKTKNKGSISDVSFEARPNEITAIVGHSGSGKTTIVNLLLRKFVVDSGDIFIDGVDILDYSDKIYSKNVVGVNQSPYLFNKSIKANLSLIDSNVDNQIEACKRVGIHDYIISLPKGYNTVLEENGNNFSGGQKQLLAIARVILSKAEVLIFDEVTSSLDIMLVDKIKEVLENLKLDHTVIIITHKKDVVKLADHIIVMNKGEVVGDGKHRSLLNNNKYYKDMLTKEYVSVKVNQEDINIEEDEYFTSIDN